MISSTEVILCTSLKFKKKTMLGKNVVFSKFVEVWHASKLLQITKIFMF